MKLHEVLKDESVLKGDMWFRPVSWKARKAAYCLKDDTVYLVPTSRGGSIGITPYVSYLCGDWEIISAEDVLYSK